MLPLFCALVSKENRKPQNSEADILIIGATASLLERKHHRLENRYVSGRSIETDQTAHISLQVSNSVKQHKTTNHKRSALSLGATPPSLSRIFPASLPEPLPQPRPFRRPTAFPPPVKGYLGPHPKTRKRENERKYEFMIKHCFQYVLDANSPSSPYDRPLAGPCVGGIISADVTAIALASGPAHETGFLRAILIIPCA